MLAIKMLRRYSLVIEHQMRILQDEDAAAVKLGLVSEQQTLCLALAGPQVEETVLTVSN